MALNQNTPASVKKQAGKKRMRLSEDQRNALALNLDLLKRLDNARKNGIRATNQLLTQMQSFGISSASVTVSGDWVN